MATLDHWNLVPDLTIKEIAALAAGHDPNQDKETLSEGALAKIKLLERLLYEASNQCWESAVKRERLIQKGVNPWDVNPRDYFPLKSINAWLPSEQLLEVIEFAAAYVDKPMIEKLGNECGVETFSRDYISNWFSAKGFKPAYTFTLSNESEQPTAQAQTIPDADYHSEKLRTLVRASTEFWKTVDRDEKSTFPKNEDVVHWLIKQGYTEKIAKSAATILRPKWATAGRPPKK